MEKSAKLLAATVALYLIIVILGLLQCVGIGLVTQRMHGCPLFSEVNSMGAFFGYNQNCNYVAYMPVIVSVVFGTIMFIYHTYLLAQSIRLPNVVPANSASGWMVSSVLAFILTLIGACLLSAGLYWFCQSNQFLLAQFFGYSTRCLPGEATALLFMGYDPYYELRMSEVAYWLSVVCWLILIIVTALRISAARRQSGTTTSGPTSLLSKGRNLMSGTATRTESTKRPILVSEHEHQAPVLETRVRHLETQA